MIMKKSIVFCVCSMLILSFCSCSQPRTEVTGVVSFPDGSPLGKGTVKGRSGGDTGKNDVVQITGNIGTDGRFTMYEVKLGDKVPAGKTYTMWVTNAAEYPQAPEGSGKDDPPPIPLIGGKLVSPNTTELSLEIPRSTKPIVYNIAVEKP